MGTKNNPGEFDCYESADPDEPMFVLLARDPLAAGLVRRWAKEYRDRKLGMRSLSPSERRKYLEALKCADQMEAWHGE